MILGVVLFGECLCARLRAQLCSLLSARGSARLCGLCARRRGARCMCGCGVWAGVCAHTCTVWAQLRPLLTSLHAAPPIPGWTLRALRRCPVAVPPSLRALSHPLSHTLCGLRAPPRPLCVRAVPPLCTRCCRLSARLHARLSAALARRGLCAALRGSARVSLRAGPRGGGKGGGELNKQKVNIIFIKVCSKHPLSTPSELPLSTL